VNDCGGSQSASTKASSHAPWSRVLRASLANAIEARSWRCSRSPSPVSGQASPVIAATQISSVYASRSAISLAIASSPSNHTITSPGRIGRSSEPHMVA
jgi:hypothetical protein